MIEMQPRCHEAYLGIGKNFFHLAEYELARTNFNEAIKLRKDFTYFVWMGINYYY